MKQKIWLSIGSPASGKSTFFSKLKEHSDSLVRLCPDEIRKELLGNENDQSKGWLVWGTYYERLEELLKTGTSDLYLDATFVDRKLRKDTLKLCKNYDVEVSGIVFEEPLITLVFRDMMRSKHVGLRVIRKFMKRFVYPVHEEGFHLIYTKKALEKSWEFE